MQIIPKNIVVGKRFINFAREKSFIMQSLTLFELNQLVRETLEQTFTDAYWLEAELAEARLASNGHFYVEFAQRDASGRQFIARARGTMWARAYALQAPLFERATGERLRAGLKVRVLVSVEFHEVYGYSLNIQEIDPAFTLGEMALRCREILDQLEADGILHDNQQLPLPRLLKRVAVVSSAGAAGYGDFQHQLLNNDYGLFFHCQLFPAVMQGAHVEESVMAALAAIADEADEWDCVVVIRGGGATSDLSDFNTYSLAAAVAQMPLPVIVGIGHERDETVLDAVAHTRVKTPTAAATFLIEHGADELAALQHFSTVIVQGAQQRLNSFHQRLLQLTSQLPRASVLTLREAAHSHELLNRSILQAAHLRLERADNQVVQLQARFTHVTSLRLERAASQVTQLQARLTALDPVHQLRRGFALAYDAQGHLLTSAAQLQVGDAVNLRLSEGSATAQITQVQL